MPPSRCRRSDCEQHKIKVHVCSKNSIGVPIAVVRPGPLRVGEAFKKKHRTAREETVGTKEQDRAAKIKPEKTQRQKNATRYDRCHPRLRWTPYRARVFLVSGSFLVLIAAPQLHNGATKQRTMRRYSGAFPASSNSGSNSWKIYPVKQQGTGHSRADGEANTVSGRNRTSRTNKGKQTCLRIDRFGSREAWPCA